MTNNYYTNKKTDTFSYMKTNNKEKIKKILQTETPIDNTLHVVCVISNPCYYEKRYKLAIDFIERMQSEKNISLYICELLYDNQKEYMVTNSENPNHLQIQTNHVLWHKENLINVSIRKLLPKNWKAVAWIDADVEFDSPHWAMDTLKLLNGNYDILQLFTHAVDMDSNENTMSVFQGFGYKYSLQRPYMKNGADYWHPGYAWACTRNAYEKMGGLYEHSILGSGDHNISYCLLGEGRLSLHPNVSEEYKKSIEKYEMNLKQLRLGYVPGVIRHYYHGSKRIVNMQIDGRLLQNMIMILFYI